MAKLFLDGIFNSASRSSSTVRIHASSFDLYGLMAGDPTFSAQNKWGPIINDISNLTDFSSLLGSDSLFSWISASTMCWKGTSPLTIGIEFYLINYRRGLASVLSNSLKKFVQLASLAEDPDATSGKDFKVRVHDGYMASVFQGNNPVFNNSELGSIDSLGSLTNVFSGDSLTEFVGGMYDAGSARGSLTLTFGNTMKIKNLLLSKVDVTKSTVEVSDQNGGNVHPLYYRVSASFIGVKPLITRDVDYMFA